MGVREYKDEPRVYIDLDGCLADFESACNAAGLPPSKFKLVPGVYRTLPLIDGAQAAVQRILDAGFEVFILSKCPSKNTGCATEKIEWVHEFFPQLGDYIILTPDKGCVGTGRDFLIDDHPEWANANNFRGTIIHFKGDWNDAYDKIVDGTSIIKKVAQILG